MNGQAQASVHFQVLTVYPDVFSSFLSQGLLGRAIEDGKLEVDLYNFREFGVGKHAKVDDTPYGGGAGMVLRPEPIVETLEQCRKTSGKDRILKVLLSPQGETFNQNKAIEFSQQRNPIALICGRFEGFDERIRSFVDEEISMGDFVLMGGEVAAMGVIESVARLVPGVIGNKESLEQESFGSDLLEYSQYTKPLVYQGMKVPEVLTSGNHRVIEEWRHNDALRKTKTRRPDLYRKFVKSHKESSKS